MTEKVKTIADTVAQPRGERASFKSLLTLVEDERAQFETHLQAAMARIAEHPKATRARRVCLNTLSARGATVKFQCPV